MDLADYLDMLEPGSAGARRTALSASLTRTAIAPTSLVAASTSKTSYTKTPLASTSFVAANPGGALLPAPGPAARTCPTGFRDNGTKCVLNNSFFDRDTTAPAETPCPSDTYWNGVACVPSLIVPPAPEEKSSAPFWLGLLAVALVARRLMR